MRDGFIFYGSFWDALSVLPDAQRLEAYDAICRYALTDEVCNLSGITAAVFKLIKPQLDANIRKRENGNKGGRPRKVTESKAEENQKETEEKPNRNLDETNENLEESNSEPKGKYKAKAKGKAKELNTNTAPSRHRYGAYGHVLLSDHDITALDEEYGHDQVREAITYLDNYCESSGKTYKNYAQAMRNWVFRAVQEQKSRNTAKPNPFTQFQQNHYSAEDFAALVSN